MLRLILAVAVAFLTMSALAMATQIAMLRYLFNSAPAPAPTGVVVDLLPPAYFLAYGAVRLVYAVIAGCMSAAIGKKYEAPTILGALMLGTAIGNLAMNRGNEPMWYAALVPLVGAVVATMAGYRWLGRMTAEGVPRRASGSR
jgi:hypothetical protein